MRYVRASLKKDQAIDRLNRGFGAGLRRLASFVYGRFSDGDLPTLELVWMPSYLVTIGLRSRGAAGETTCNVDGCSGSFSLFQMHEVVESGAIADETFSPVHDEASAERIARAELTKTILRRRGQTGKPVPEETRGIELLLYPYWVYYYQRRRGLIDIRVLDAATGRPAGMKIKMGILKAFCAAQTPGIAGAQEG